MLRQKRPKNTEKHIILKTKFEQLVRKIEESVKKGLRWQPNAILALHTAREDYISEVTEETSFAADRAKRRTNQPKDITLVRQISKNNASLIPSL